jgi:hypothetical protein
MPLCFSDCRPSDSSQGHFRRYSTAKLSALSQYETTSSRSESRIGGENRDTESLIAGIDFAYLEKGKQQQLKFP